MPHSKLCLMGSFCKLLKNILYIWGAVMAKAHVGGTHCSYNKITYGRAEDMAAHSMHAVHIHACVTI